MLVDALQHKDPALVEVAVSRQELAMPPSLQQDEVIGFSLCMIKAVLNGHGDEILDLAKINLFRSGQAAEGKRSALQRLTAFSDVEPQWGQRATPPKYRLQGPGYQPHPTGRSRSEISGGLPLFLL